MRFTPLLMTLGYVLLTTGVACYGIYALSAPPRDPRLALASFSAVMLCLLCFNLPAVLARRSARRREDGEDGAATRDKP